MLAVIFGVTSCASEPVIPETKSPESSDTMFVQATAPPETTSPAKLEGIALTALRTSWYDDDKKEHIFSDRHKLTASDLVNVNYDNNMTLQVLSPVVPAFINIRPFSRISAKDIPTQESTTILCEYQKAPCVLDQTDTDLSATFSIPKDTAFVTIEVFYHVSEMGLEQQFNYVSYGANLISYD